MTLNNLKFFILPVHPLKTLRPQRFGGFLVMVAGILLGIQFSLHCLADSDGPPPPGPDDQHILTPPSIIDKLLCAESVLGPGLKLDSEDAWAPKYKELYTSYHIGTGADLVEGKSDAVLAMELGEKASDGILALKARDTEALNDCADAIQKIAVKLKVPPEELEKAAVIHHQALEKHWIEAFMELGYLQQSISEFLEENPQSKDEGLLIILGGWIQGGRCVTSLIKDNYTPQSSNILREPKLVQVMRDMAGDMRPEYKSDPTVKLVLDFLPDVQKRLDVGIHDPIPPTDVDWMHDHFDSLARQIAAPGVVPKN